MDARLLPEVCLDLKSGERVFEARATNIVAGDYKGYPLDPTEWPGWIE